MFITEEESNYSRVFAELLELTFRIGAIENAPSLGGTAEGDTVTIPLFGSRCEVRRDGVYDNGGKVDTIGSILTVRYLLKAGNEAPQGVWLPYRDLRDGAQFSTYIKAHLEDRIAETFSGKKALLQERLQKIGGKDYCGEMTADISATVRPLPRVPVLCRFWDRDDEFPASFQFLFDASALSYLDLESLAAALQYIYLKITEEP